MRMNAKELIAEARITSPTLPPAAAKLMSDMADRLDVQYAVIRESQAQLHAVVAESVGTNGFVDAMLDVAWNGGSVDGSEIQEFALNHGLIRQEVYCADEHESLVEDPGNFEDGDDVYFRIETPATGAAIAALRAESRKEGAIFAANRILAAWDAGFVKDTPENAADVPDERYQHLSELYHAQEKRLFKMAQRIKGPSFDKYAYSPSQAIDALEAAIWGEQKEDGSACRAAMQADGTLVGEGTMQAEPVTAANTLPPHIYRELVNQLRDTAVKYQGCQQLREQISATLSTVITPAVSEQQNGQQNIPEYIPGGLIEAVNRLLDNDGSRGCYSAIKCYDAHEEIERLLAAAPAAPEQEV